MQTETECLSPASCAPQPRRARGPWLRLLSAVLELAGPRAELLRHAERPWTSATFSGTRHTVALTFTGPDGIVAGEEFLAALPDHEFTITGQLVADAAVSLVEHEAGANPGMTIEADLLLLEDI